MAWAYNQELGAGSAYRGYPNIVSTAGMYGRKAWRVGHALSTESFSNSYFGC